MRMDVGVVVLAAIATPVRADGRFDARGDEIVALVRDNFVDAARAEAWAAKHRGYAATVRDEAGFAARTDEILAELATSHTAFYPRGSARHPMLSAVFQDGLKSKSSYASLGIDLARTANGVFVQRVFPGGAGEAAGLLRGDRIVSVDGKPADPALPLAARADRAVRLEVQRAPQQPPIELRATPVLINPKQEWLAMQRTGSHIVDREGARVGYHPMFSCAGAEHEAALRDALAGDLAAAAALVLDFRDGWGGCNASLVDVFSPVAPTVTSAGRGGKRSTMHGAWRRPLVLLVNAGSRSGKEVVAFVLKQHRLATLVGARTAGAVMTGRVFPLSDGSLLYLAVADVLVDGQRLEGVGVSPDVEVSDALEYAQGRDPQLERAFAIAAHDARARIAPKKQK
jgi:carboxyl-terminal processing protease